MTTPTLSNGDLKRAHDADLQMLGIVYFCREEVTRKRKDLQDAIDKLRQAEESYERQHQVVESAAVPTAIAFVASFSTGSG